MKITTILLVIILVTCGLSAQDKPERAPLNPEYIKYLEYQRSYEFKKSAGEKGYGYIPELIYYHFDVTKVIEDSKKSTASLPAKYDLRDYMLVTDYGIERDSVKDQGPAGACWTFSSVGAIESNWLKMGKPYIDLSELNMATCHGFNAGVDDGGNNQFVLAYLTSLKGPVTEESQPYSPDPSATCKTTDLVKTAYTLTSASIPKNTELVKKAILDYGAVSASIHMGEYSRYLSRVNHTYCYPGNEAVDHAVLIIGWDDNKTVTGGADSPPSSTGAWIVKNSWGTTFADKGYFYVGYRDSKILTSSLCFPGRVELDEVDTLYMYDELGAITSFGFREETGIGLVKYTAPEEHFVNRVGTFTNTYGSYVDIEIYTGIQGGTLTGLIASSYNNYRQFPGYHTFDISTLVTGDFYVKVKYTTPGYTYPVPAEVSIPPVATPQIQASGKCWISEDGTEWTALGSDIPDMEADLSIRVYAEKKPEYQAYFTSDKSITCLDAPLIFTDYSRGNITSYEWNFGTDASPATATGEGPHEVTWTSEGFKTINLKITDNQDSVKTLTKINYIRVYSEPDIIVPFSERTVVRRRPVTLYAAGADTYEWSPADGLNTTTGPVVTASPLVTTTYTVTGTLGTCTGSATIALNVLPNPANDDACDAIQLNTIGFFGPYTNVNATVQQDEPSPPEGDCSTPMEWCVEGGLHNSVWFWFYGPETGIVSIDTEGMDNQIAVYEADHCDSIFSETGHKMVAAFDDYHDEDKFFAAAIQKLNIIHGQKYFLQVDGSAGGEEGYFTIKMSEYPISVGKIKAGPKGIGNVTIYPNPGSGLFNIRFHDMVNSGVNVKVYNLTGQVVYNMLWETTGQKEISINLSSLGSGFYIIELSDRREFYRQTLVVE